MKGNFHALILAGGIGVRLWPKSRVFRPKQFLRFDNDLTFLEKTVRRIERIFKRENIWILCKPYQQEQLRTILPEFPEENIIIEPSPKGTCAAILFGSLFIDKSSPGATVSVFPSDHLIRDENRFYSTLLSGQKWAEENMAIVIYGIRPQRAETSYGYIELGPTLGKVNGFCCMEVRGFHEKPDKRTARAYFKSKRFLWNSGMLSFFVKNVSSLLNFDDFSIWRPLIELSERAFKNKIDLDIEKGYRMLPEDPFDTAFLEKISGCKIYSSRPPLDVVVFPCDFEWHDMGLWESVYRISTKDESGNAISGKAFALSCKNSLLMSEDGVLVAAIGLEDMVVVFENDAILVCPRDQLERIKELVEGLRKKGFEKYT